MICMELYYCVHYCDKHVIRFFISVFNQLDAQNLFHNKFYFMPLHVSSICAHHQEVKIALHSLWYHNTNRFDDTRGCVMQFWPPDDEHMCSKHVEAWNKTYCETNSVLARLAAGSSNGLTNTVPDAVLISWWWTENPSETCRASYRNK